MQEKDIYNQKWKISENLEKTTTNLNCIDIAEQSCDIHIIRSGIEDPSNPEVTISCNYCKYINRLAESRLFTLKRVVISNQTRSEGHVLDVEGSFDIKGVVIRKDRVKVTQEDKKRRSEFLRQVLMEKHGSNRILQNTDN